jgi:hypothetical protein
VIKALSSEYIASSQTTFRIRTPGYSNEYVDTTTVGVSGALSLDLESKDEVDKLSSKDYIP